MIVSALMQSVLLLLLDALLVAIASRLFQALADRGLQPPDGSLTVVRNLSGRPARRLFLRSTSSCATSLARVP
jgi:hypothetical protein